MLHPPEGQDAIEHPGAKRLVAGQVAPLIVENRHPQADSTQRRDDLGRRLREGHAFAMESVGKNSRLFVLRDNHIAGEGR